MISELYSKLKIPHRVYYLWICYNNLVATYVPPLLCISCSVAPHEDTTMLDKYALDATTDGLEMYLHL